MEKNELEHAQAYARALSNVGCAQQDEKKYGQSSGLKHYLERSKQAAQDAYTDLTPEQRVRLQRDLEKIKRGEATLPELCEKASREVFSAAAVLQKARGR